MLAEKKDYYYLRLSKEDGDVEDGTVEESCSIQSQRACIQRYLKDQSFLDDTFEELVDDGFSGTNMNRPGIRQLLRLVEEGKVRTIIVRDLSRFARNYLEAGHYLEFIFPAYDVRFISINDHFDSQKLGESTGGLELAIRNLINQLYSKDISRKIKSAVDLKKLNGEYVYGTAPYGYKKGSKKNTIVVDPEAAEIVKQIFTWASEGITVTQIARKLNDAEVTTPSVYLAAVRGKYKTKAFWTYESVRNILANRIYTGDTVPFKSHVVRVGSDRVKQIPEELWQVIPDTHEAIISRELYYQARTVIKSTKKSKQTVSRNPFTSLLVCGCCGNRLAKGKAQNKNWLCSTARYKSGLGCEEVRFSEEKLKKIVLRAIVTQCDLMNARVKKVKREGSAAKSKEQILQNERRKLRRQIEQAQASKMQYYEDYVSGKISKEDFVLKKQEASQSEESLKLQLNIIEHDLTEYDKMIQAAVAQVSGSQKFTQYQDIAELTPELTKELVKRIVIYPDGILNIEWNFHDEIAPLIEIRRIDGKIHVG